MTVYVTLDSYIVERTTEKALGLRKAKQMPGLALTWVPRSVVEDGENIDIGEQDLSCAEWFAEKEGLDV